MGPTLLRKSRRQDAAGPPAGSQRSKLLFLIDEVGAAVLLPARFRRFGTNRLLLAEADGADAIRSHAGLGQRVLDGLRAVVTESDVVLGGAALVAVSLDREFDVGMLREPLRIGLGGGGLVGPQVVLVVV